jgi:hypothetical protein
MPPPVITSPVKFTARGTSKVYWIPTIANRAAPTRLELNAGQDLSPSVTDSSGWSVSTEQIEAPSLADRYTPTIPGSISAEDSSLTLFASRNGIDARTLMARDNIGNIVWMDGGDTAGNKADVYPVTVSSVSKQRQVRGGDPDTLVISYAITDVPSENVTVPA